MWMGQPTIATTMSSASHHRPITFLATTSQTNPHLNESVSAYKSPAVVQDVNCYNLEEEMQKISRIVQRYSYCALDTEFPGTLDFPVGTFDTCADYEYALFKSNVDRMNIIQLGMSFFDADGNQPAPIHTWQFNFRFNLEDELHAPDSIQMLEESGIDFAQHQTTGIEPNHFAERLVTSGIVCNNAVRFLTFHSAYDFGYLYKTLEGKETLPNTEAGFLEVIRMYFPKVFDIKYMLKDSPTLKGGLQDLANQFRLTRTGNQHQAGSDSALTGSLFFRLKRDVFPTRIDHFIGQLYGLSGVLALDRVRRLENVIIRKNSDGSIHIPAAFYGIKEPRSPALTDSSRHFLSRGAASSSALFGGGLPSSQTSEWPSSYFKMPNASNASKPAVGFAHSLSLASIAQQYPDSYTTYGHNGTVYYT